MSIAERMPTSTRGRWVTLTGAALLWAAAYWVNERLWDWVFYDLFGMAPADAGSPRPCTSSSTTRSRSRCCCRASSS